ncbi:MAG: hypothetical protein NVS9B14_02380 [Candidatus Acidiferrum sp.]
MVVREDYFADTGEVYLQVTRVDGHCFRMRSSVQQNAVAIGFDEGGESPFAKPGRLSHEHRGEHGDFEGADLPRLLGDGLCGPLDGLREWTRPPSYQNRKKKERRRKSMAKIHGDALEWKEQYYPHTRSVCYNSGRWVVGQFEFLTPCVTNNGILLAEAARREKKFKLTD